MALTKVSLVDLNAGELILDLDADTSITSDTDDTIHFKIGGSDEITITGTALSPSTSDGNALGTAALEWSDLFLADGAVISFGDDQDVTLTHVADTGLLLSSTDRLQFGDAGTFIHQSADGVLDLVSDTEIELNATTLDINANVEISGTATTTGVHTFGAIPVFPNNTVETADIQDDAITLDKMASGTDGNLITYNSSGNPVAVATGSDGQVLTSTGAGSAPVFEALPTSGITEVDMWRLTSSTSLNADTETTVSSGWVRCGASSTSSHGFTKIGTGMSEASGTWTFPSTGIWQVNVHARFSNSNASARYVTYKFYASSNAGSNYAEAINMMTNLFDSDSSTYSSVAGTYIFDVTNASQFRFYQRAISITAASITGNANVNETYYTFVKLAET